MLHINDPGNDELAADDTSATAQNDLATHPTDSGRPYMKSANTSQINAKRLKSEESWEEITNLTDIQKIMRII